MHTRAEVGSPVLESARIVDGPKPKYLQLCEILRQLVEHELPQGAPIPSERDLAQRFRVSRLTVRSAVGQLVADGLLASVRGKGTYPVSPRMELQLELMSFTADMRRRGRKPNSAVLATGEEVPPPDTARALRLPTGERAYLVSRLRSADDTPLAVERGWYHRTQLSGLLELDLADSLYRQLAQRHGVVFDRASQTVWTEPADRRLARLLGISVGTPLLAFRRVSSAHGVPMEDMTSWYRGDLYQVTMRLDEASPNAGYLQLHP